MIQNITFASIDQRSCRGFLAKSPTKRAVVVIQEWWGLNDNIRLACERLASMGYTALAPDLYHGVLAKNADEAREQMQKLDFSRAVEEIRAAALHLKKNEGATSIAVLGFCMGGALTLLTALRATEFQAAVCFYGIPPKSAGDLAGIRIPVQAHFATTDDWCTPESVETLEADFSRGKVPSEVHRYGAQHAFANEKRPEVYDAEAAAQAWKRVFEFLSKTL